MKKKLLSVLMAGALVATSSVNTFATPNVTGSEDVEHKTNIDITGNIENKNGETQPGTISVKVPTAASFTLKNDGTFLGTTIKVENRGVGKVDVYAEKFIDVTPDTNITVVKKADVAERGEVSLYLQGSASTAYFGSSLGDGQNGVYNDEILEHQNGSIKLATIDSNNHANLTLGGSGAVGNDEDAKKNAISDKFTLILKIAKATE